MIRVLMVLGGSMGYGGTEAFLMNYYRNIDKNRIQFDFVFQGDEPGVYDDEIKEYGGMIYHVPFKNRHPMMFTKQLRDIIHKGSYKIVHGQMDTMNWWPLRVAKKAGAPVRISHSHSTEVHGTSLKKVIINNIVKGLIPLYATDLWACSIEAGEWLYGSKLLKDGKVSIINNAIDKDAFLFNQELRNRIRNQYDISETTFVVGHCGRLAYQKNHRFLLKVFAKVYEKERDSILLLIGDGELRAELEKLADDLKIRDRVIFAGNQRYPYNFYNAMDIFVFPSIYEGLGITFLEAQLNGLFCVCSDRITKEGYISDAVGLSIEDSPEEWCDVIIKNKNRGRSDNTLKLIEKGFDINIEAEKIMNLYESLVKNNI